MFKDSCLGFLLEGEVDFLQTFCVGKGGVQMFIRSSQISHFMASFQKRGFVMFFSESTDYPQTFFEHFQGPKKKVLSRKWCILI